MPYMTMTTNRAMTVPEFNTPIVLEHRALPEPARGQVRIRIHACGVCHSDSYALHGGFPGMRAPLVPGHEIVGTVDALGEDAQPWSIGDRVGLGWYGGSCGWCEPCRRGLLLNCHNTTIPGISSDGGYADYIVARANALARVPENLSSAEAAPLMCAGVTTFNGLRHSTARGGDLVAVLGIGGLGHLAVQFAGKMGFRTVAIARGADKASFAHELGAERYIDSTVENPGAVLASMGGAKVIVSTVIAADAVTAAMPGMGIGGELLILGAPSEPLALSPAFLIPGSKRIQGWASGASMDSQDTLEFAARNGIRVMTEKMPLEQAGAALDRMLSGKARFRVVLETGA